MDLQDQHAYMRKTGQWRFTPPTHVVAALHEALSQYEEEGGLPARQRRYASNCETLLGEMARLGFRSFLPAEIKRRSSLPSTRRAIRATASPTSTNACGRRASSSIRAS